MRKIYLASSWRNPQYESILAVLRGDGHSVYDFKEEGFGWADISPAWLNWTPEEFTEAVVSPKAVAHFKTDHAALDWADTCVLLLPCGRSAHLEAGYAIGQGKETYFLLHPDKFEPELMYLLGGRHCMFTDLDDLRAQLCFPLIRPQHLRVKV